MKDKNLPPDIDAGSLEELTEKANQIIESLENENFIKIIKLSINWLEGNG